MSSDLIGGYLSLDLNQPIKWGNFRLDALLANKMLIKIAKLTWEMYCGLHFQFRWAYYHS
jgi:hypothetical protein